MGEERAMSYIERRFVSTVAYYAGYDDGFGKGLGIGIVSVSLIALVIAWVFA